MHSPSLSRSQSGFSLVELMVGALLGLIGTVVIFQMFAVSEEQKRATTGAGESVQTAATALFQIQRDGMSAGYGLSKFLYGCWINGWYDNGAGGQNIRINLAPVRITKGTGSASDQITFFSSANDLSTLPTGLLVAQAASGGELRVLNRFGFKAGDLVIAINLNEADPALKDCSLAQVSALPTTAGLEDRIRILPGSYVNAAGQTRPIQYNRPGGLSAPYDIAYKKWANSSSRGGLVFNIGTLPRMVTYRVLDRRLVIGAELAGGDPIPIADEVVQFKVQYGVDGGDHTAAATAPTAPDRRIDGTASNTALSQANLGTTATDHWAEELPPLAAGAVFTPQQWSKIIAVRMVVVTRGEKLRPNPVSGVCEATSSSTAPKWSAAGNVPLDVTSDPDWRCFKYTVQEMTVPLRNLIWSPAELGIQPTTTNDL